MRAAGRPDGAGSNIEATGKRVPNTRRTKGGLRKSRWKTEVRHNCGHVWWTTHIDADRFFETKDANEKS